MTYFSISFYIYHQKFFLIRTCYLCLLLLNINKPFIYCMNALFGHIIDNHTVYINQNIFHIN